jgi:hypothetical protein
MRRLAAPGCLGNQVGEMCCYVTHGGPGPHSQVRPPWSQGNGVVEVAASGGPMAARRGARGAADADQVLQGGKGKG